MQIDQASEFRRIEGERVPAPRGQGGAAREPPPRARGRREPIPRHPRIRADRPPVAPQRDPLQARLPSAGAARTGQDATPADARSTSSTRRSRRSPGASSTKTPSSRSPSTARRILAEKGDATPIAWIPRAERYRGEARHARRDDRGSDRRRRSDQGGDRAPLLLRRGSHPLRHHSRARTAGIFAINELPDLQPRIQVGLLNILEERDLQIRGFPIRIPLDILLVFSANPEDYTNRGNIITPLKDRISSQILTHYPDDVKTAREDHRAGGVARARRRAAGRDPRLLPRAHREVAFAARSSEFVDQSSGVSARHADRSDRELLASNLERRALNTARPASSRASATCPRRSPAITGKVEMVYEGEQQGAEVVAKKLIGSRSRSSSTPGFRRRTPAVPRSAAATSRKRRPMKYRRSAAPAPGPGAGEDPSALRADRRVVRRRQTRSPSPTTRRSRSTSRRWNPCPACEKPSKNISLPPRRRSALSGWSWSSRV